MEKDEFSKYYPLPFRDPRGLASSDNAILKELPEIEKNSKQPDSRDRLLLKINKALAKISEYKENPFKKYPEADVIYQLASEISENPKVWIPKWYLFPYNDNFYSNDTKYSLKKISIHLPEKLREVFGIIFTNVYKYIDYSWKRLLPSYPDFYYYFGINGYVYYIYNDCKKLYEKIYQYLIDIDALNNALFTINNCSNLSALYKLRKNNCISKLDYAITYNKTKIILANKPVVPVIPHDTDYVDYDIKFFKKEFNIYNNEYIAPLAALLELTTEYLKHYLNKTDMNKKAEKFIFNYRAIANKNAFAMKIIDYDTVMLDVTNDMNAVCLKPSLLPYCSMPELKDYYPEKFIKCLKYLFYKVDIYMIPNLAAFTANCLHPSPISKKLFLIKTDNEESQEIIKSFLRRLVSSVSENPYKKDIIEPATVKEFCDQRRMKKLYNIRYANVKAAFLDKTEEVSRGSYRKLKNLLLNRNRVSNEIKGYHNNIQPVIFQTTDLTGDFKSKDTIIFDFSDVTFPDFFKEIPEKDFHWAKVYFAFYGYLLLEKPFDGKKEPRFIFDIPPAQFEAERKELIKEITERFLDICFVSVNEAKEVAKERPKRIKALKEYLKTQNYERINNKSSVSQEEQIRMSTYMKLTELLENKPLYVTFKDEFLVYIKKFIKTQYKSSEIKKYDITPKALLKYFMSNARYKRLYPYKDVHLKYIRHKRNDAFRFLCLKDRWEIIAKELDRTDVNFFDGFPDRPPEGEIDFYNVIMTDIDFSRIEHFSFKDAF